MAAFTSQRARAIWITALVITAILAILYFSTWVGVYTHIYASSVELVDQINGYNPGEAPLTVTFTGDDVTKTTRAYADAVVAYAVLGSMTFVTIAVGFPCLLASLVIAMLKKTRIWWMRILVCLTAVATLMLIVFSGFMMSIRFQINRESTRTHVMASEWCDDTTVSWDRTLTPGGLSCDVPKSVYDDNDGPSWPDAKDCCSLPQYGTPWTDIKYFCCMFQAPYDFQLKSGGGLSSPFENLQQNLRDGTYTSPTRKEYVLQPQFINDDIWKQNPDGWVLLGFDAFTFIALWDLIVLMTIMTAILITTWIRGDTELRARFSRRIERHARTNERRNEAREKRASRQPFDGVFEGLLKDSDSSSDEEIRHGIRF